MLRKLLLYALSSGLAARLARRLMRGPKRRR